MTDKERIKKSFSRAAGTYDAHSGLQREVASLLAERIRAYINSYAGAMGPAWTPAYATAPFPGPSSQVLYVLDVGCGTGWVIEALGRALPDARICGSDISLAMLGKAREKPGATALVASDCEALPFADDSFDVIASSLTYQWSGDLRASIREAVRTLRSGGLFAFSTLGPSTMRELYECYSSICEYQRPVELRGPDEIRGLMEEAGLEAVTIENVRIVKNYPHLMRLARTLKNIGASPNRIIKGSGLSGALLKEAGRVYAQRHPAPDGTGILATYDVIYLLARKG
ncbi:MAG: methyltransferase domain-containing protein [Deltaproteobacteria bacterium]|nr:methyltransferase domain-containing protein [Deltaproteobacteria bacterium]